MKLGIDAEKFLTEWAMENSDELVDYFDSTINSEHLSNEEKIKKIYTRTLNFIFLAISRAISENNKAIEKQLRRSGVIDSGPSDF